MEVSMYPGGPALAISTPVSWFFSVFKPSYDGLRDLKFYCSPPDLYSSKLITIALK